MLLMEQVMTRCMVKTICMKKWNRESAAKHQIPKIKAWCAAHRLNGGW